MIVSQAVFTAFITVFLVLSAAGWGTVEALRLRRTLREDTSDPVVRDQIVGSIVGIAIGLLGLLGVAHHYFF